MIFFLSLSLALSPNTYFAPCRRSSAYQWEPSTCTQRKLKIQSAVMFWRKLLAQNPNPAANVSPEKCTQRSGERAHIHRLAGSVYRTFWGVCKLTRGSTRRFSLPPLPAPPFQMRLRWLECLPKEPLPLPPPPPPSLRYRERLREAHQNSKKKKKEGETHTPQQPLPRNKSAAVCCWRRRRGGGGAGGIACSKRCHSTARKGKGRSASATHTWEDAWRGRRSSPAPSFGCWDWEHCTEPEPSMPIGRQRRAGCWLPGLGSPHYSWGGVGSSHAGSYTEGCQKWFLPNCFPPNFAPFFIATVIPLPTPPLTPPAPFNLTSWLEW